MASTVTELLRRRFGGKKEVDPYVDAICFDFELTQAASFDVTLNHNNVLTYLDALIVDGTAIMFGKGTTYSFAQGTHKIGWRFKDITTVPTNVIPSIKTSSNGSLFASNKYSLTIPECVEAIESYAMRACPAYTTSSVYAYPTTPPTVGTGGIGLWNCNANRPLYVPAPSINDYKAANGWSSYSSAITAMP